MITKEEINFYIQWLAVQTRDKSDLGKARARCPPPRRPSQTCICSSFLPHHTALWSARRWPRRHFKLNYCGNINRWNLEFLNFDTDTVINIQYLQLASLRFAHLFFVDYTSYVGCINLKKFIWFWAKLWHFQKSFGFLYLNLRLKLLWQFFYFLFIAITWPNFINWECFGIPKTSSDNGSIIFYVKIEEP